MPLHGVSRLCMKGNRYQFELVGWMIGISFAIPISTLAMVYSLCAVKFR
jgi:hypothetical protein